MAVDQSSNPRYVLIVERDDLIRALLERWLGEAGYVAVQDPSPGRVALVIADVSDPRQSGAVARELRARHGAPVLLTSGRIRANVAAPDESAHRFGVRRVLPKPFTREEFLLAVDETLKDG